MCGIAGAISAEGIDTSALAGMAQAIRHRGPDGQGFLLHGPDHVALEARASVGDADGGPGTTVGLAHLRLSIIDLTRTSDQPMVNEAGDLAMIYNGETYNYLELRQELESLGHVFRSTGDSEVVLEAYAEWGPECLRRLVGMWSFAIVDVRRGEVFLSVDRFGIKPLYYTVAGGTFYFASEIKALLEAPAVRPEPDESTVRRYLLAGGVDESESTFFEGIKRVPGAHALRVSLGGSGAAPVPERYWSVPQESYRGSREEAARDFKDLFADSVRVHLRSDVPIGTCLSGGLDSSAIVCVADELRLAGRVPSYAHHGFGYVPEEETVSERPYMQAVVDKTSLEMTYVEVSPRAFGSALGQVVRLQDEPFLSASVAAQWFVFDAARRAGLKVMLDGQGADEVLGGYHSYLNVIGHMMVRKRRLLSYVRYARQHRKLLGRAPMPLKQVAATMRAGDGGAEPIPAPQLAPSFPGASVLTERLLGRTQSQDVAFPAFDSVHELLSAQVSWQGLPALLRYEDRNSMAHSIEARVPFLDHRLVEFAFSLPDDYRIHGVETKDVLRRGLDDVLPRKILDRKDKIGFRAEPSATWDLARGNRDAFLANRTPQEEAWFDPAGLRALLEGSSQDASSEFLLWRALNTKLWLRHFWGDGADPLG